MRSLVKALAVVLTVPVICTALALTSRNELDSRWRATLRRPFLVRRQTPDERVIARYSLAAMCGDPRAAVRVPPCRPYNLFSSMATGAAATGAVGVAFLAAIAAAGAACRSRRDRLSRLFKPALYATVSGLVVLVLLHGALGAVGVVLLGEVIQRWPASLVLVLAAATVAAALSMVRLALSVTRRESPALVARALNLEAQRALAQWVGEVSQSVGAASPGHLLAGLHPVLFVSDAPVVCLDGRITGRSICLPLTVARILSIDEFRGLVAHELAHYAPAQASDSSRLVPLHAGVRRSLRTLSHRSSSLHALTALPALAVLSLFMEAFEPAVGAAYREREESADRVAAGIVGARTLASALVKSHAFTPAWESVLVAMDRAVIDGMQYVNASALFAQVAAGSSGPERLAGVGALASIHPVDIHPSLAERLSALGVPLADVSPSALVLNPPDPAIGLVEGHEAIERDLSEVEHRVAAAAWGPREDGETDVASGFSRT